MIRNTITCADSLDYAKSLPDNSVHCIVTSPPYYGLRDYGAGGQIGLEETPQEYLRKLVELFREYRRVLRKDGTLWLNIGDSYWGGKGQSGHGGKEYQQLRSENGASYNSPEAHVGGKKKTRPTDRKSDTFKPKDLMMIPARLAIALCDDGWWLRQEIVWAKLNGMPESVQDRCTRSHEMVYMLTKSPDYWYDAEAIKQESKQESTARAQRAVSGDHKNVNGAPGQTPHTLSQPRPNAHKQDGVGDRRYTGFNERYDDHAPRPMSNARDVWFIATEPTPFAHFATFPQKLVERCILAGCPHKTCSACGAPWVRIFEKTGHVNKREAAHAPNNAPTKVDSSGWDYTNRPTGDWTPTCDCSPGINTEPGIVLDPFMGSGTVALVARKLGRDFLGCDLNPEYVKLANSRLDVPYTLPMVEVLQA